MGNTRAEAQPAPLKVWHIIHMLFPEITFEGIVMPPGHDEHSKGRALDLGLHATNPSQRQLADALVAIFLNNAAEVGWAYMIWNRQIWYNDARGGPRSHTGPNPHTNHIHISWARSKSQITNFPNFTLTLENYARTRTRP